MKGLSLLLVNKVYQLDYDIVYDKYDSVKILVFPDTGFDNIVVEHYGKCIKIEVYDTDIGFKGYAYICLKHKVKSVEYKVKNGILTVKVKYKRFLLF